MKMSFFFSKLDAFYNWFNDEVYKYLLFLYYLNWFSKPVYAIFMGILAGLSLPPFNMFFLLPLAIATIIRMTDFCQTKKASFVVGFFFSFGFFLSSTYWVSFAMLTDVRVIWIFPFALIGMPIVLGLFNALIFPIYLAVVENSSAIKKIFVFSALWCMFEYLRGYVVFWFPWNFLGYAFSISTSIMQVTSVMGILGFSFFVILWAGSFHILMLTGDKDDFVKYFKFLICTNLILILFYLFGKVVLLNKKTTFTDARIRIVQGNSPVGTSSHKEFDKNLETYLKLTISRNLEGIDYIIWPEGSVSSFVYNQKKIKERIASFLTQDQILITGSVRLENINEKLEIFNSMIILNSKASVSYYDKNYLVPFGEFNPIKSLIPVPAIVNQFQDFSRGTGMETIKPSPSAPPFAPLICYEIAFSGKITNSDLQKPEWILNITNDAWYGFSSGPFQHLEIAKVRAIEEGMPVVRAANSGISAVFDSRGRMLYKTKLFKEQVLDFNLPTKQVLTLFSIYGNYPFMILLTLFLTFIIGDYIYFKNDKKINHMGYALASRKLKRKPKKK